MVAGAAGEVAVRGRTGIESSSARSAAPRCRSSFVSVWTFFVTDAQDTPHANPRLSIADASRAS